MGEGNERKRVLVTGASDFIGRHVTRAILVNANCYDETVAMLHDAAVEIELIV